MRFPSLLRAFALAAAVSLTAAPSFAQTVVIPVVRVAAAPPPVRVEAQPAAPAAGYTWIQGHWHWNGSQHVWVGGHWAVAPVGGYVWEPARWVPENGQFAFYEGHWKLAAAPVQEVYQPPPPPAQQVVIDAAPPAPIVEVRPAAPYVNAQWLPGYWNWHGGRHFWVSGRYSLPYAGHTWEPHRWVLEGGRYRFYHGRWR